MRTTIPAFLLLAVWPAPPEQPARRYELDPAHSTVWIDADATLGAFRGKSSTLTGWLEFTEPAYRAVRAHIELPAATLKTGIGRRDRHLRETLATDRFPTIVVDVDSARQDTASFYRVWARMTIRGVNRPIELTASVAEHGDTIRVTGRFLSSFTNFDMKPPSRLLGTAKVKNDFAIGFECAFRRME